MLMFFFRGQKVCNAHAIVLLCHVVLLAVSRGFFFFFGSGVVTERRGGVGKGTLEPLHFSLIYLFMFYLFFRAELKFVQSAHNLVFLYKLYYMRMSSCGRTGVYNYVIIAKMGKREVAERDDSCRKFLGKV